MTNEKMLTKIYQMVKTLPEDDQKVIEKFSKANMPKAPVENIVFYLAQAIYELKEDITAETAKKAGRTSALNAAKAILKGGAKIRDVFGYAPIIDGKQYICNGYLVVELSKPFDLPEVPKNMIYPEVKRFFNETFYNKLELPEVAKLKTFIKDKKAKKEKAQYCFGEGAPLVDAEYLAQVMDLLPDAIAYCDAPLKPIYFECEAGRAILLPIKPKDGTPREKTEI